MSRRILQLSSAAVLALAIATVGAFPASAGPAASDVNVGGVQDSVVSPGGTGTAEFYVDVNQTPLTTATFVATLGQGLTATKQATFDGAPVAAQVVGQRVTITLPTPVSVDDNHQLGIGVRLAVSAAKPVAVSGTLTYTDTAGPGTATAAPQARVVPDLPDLNVTAGTDSSVTLKGSVPGSASIQVSDERSNSSGAVLTLTPSGGFSVSGTPVTGNTQRSLPCRHDGASVVCNLRPADLHHFIFVPLAASASATRGSLRVSVATSNGAPDAVPSNNVRTIALRHTGTSDLKVMFDHGDASILPNGTANYRVTIRNDGPDPATDLEVRLVVLAYPGHFVATFAGQNVRTVTPGQFATLNVGTLAVGASRTVQASITGSDLGTNASFQVGLSSSSYDPGYCIDRSCDAQGYRRVSVVSSLPSTSGTGSGSAAGGAGSGLADTGSPTTPLTVLGLALLAAGALTQFAGRRRVS